MNFLKYLLTGLLILTCVELAAQESGDAQEPGESESCVDGTDSETCPEEDSGLDSDGSIDDAESSIGDAVEKRGWTLGGDLRISFVHADVEFTDVQSLNIDQIRTRWRLQSSYGITESLRVNTRLAGLCSSDECQPEFYLEPEIPTPVSIEDGQITLDELFLHWFRTERFDLAIGRLQTKFITRGGVYAKSLDRNDSNNLRVNWTDGVHAVRRFKNDWPPT